MERRGSPRHKIYVNIVDQYYKLTTFKIGLALTSIIATRCKPSSETTSAKCDSWTSNKWYRFVKTAGTSIPRICPYADRCGANTAGWINGKHATVEEGEVTRTVCYQYRTSCCYWSRQFNVYNCSDFYVYKLPSVTWLIIFFL